MNKANRAAQFNPFDALKGLQEALKEKEEQLSRTEKRELSEEKQEEISCELNKLERGSLITVTYFDKGHYRVINAKVKEVSAVYRYIILESMTKICFDNIYEIKTE